MARALQDAMPEVKHGLCIFHLHRNGIKHLGNLMKDGSHFIKDLNKCLYNYDEESEFEDAWEKLLSTYNLKENSWLSSIYKIKEKWDACYMKHAFTIGMRSTQLSESINSSLKDCMNPELDINRFFKLFELVVNDKRYAELQHDFATREKLPRLIVQSAPMLHQVSQIYTPNIFHVFQCECDYSCACRIKERNKLGDVKKYVIRMITKPGEWRVTYDTTNGSTNCSCMKFEQYGIICCHVLRIYTHLEVDELPKQYIIKRWTREARCEVVQDILGNEINVDPKLESSMRYRQLCPMFVRLVSEASKCQETFNIVQQTIIELNKKVNDILAMCESFEDETSSKMCTKCAITAIFKKKEGNKHKRRYMPWVDNQPNKKRKVQSKCIYKDAKVA